MSEGMIEVDEGVQLFYAVTGVGPDIVLMPNGFHFLQDLQPLAADRRIVCYDVRNRGRSSTLTDPSQLARGVHQDVDDLDVVRRHFAAPQVDVLAHSYVSVVAILGAMRFPAAIRRVVAIGAIGPRPSIQYPPPLSNPDGVQEEVLARLRDLERDRQSLSREAFCRQFWRILRRIYVTEAADAEKIHWSRCELPNELNFMRYWAAHLQPSLDALALTDDDFGRIVAPVLLIHGTRDRSAPYGGAREWARRLPHSRLLPVDGAGHAPWVENPSLVFGALRGFLDDGTWPPDSVVVG